MKKAVIYARFSSEKQNEMSIEGQVRACSEYAALQAKLSAIENEMQSLLGELERAKKGAITKEKVERKLLDVLSAPTDRLKDRILKDLVVRVVCYKDHNEVFFTTTQPPHPLSNPSESSNNSSCGSPNYALFELNLAVYVGFVVLRIEK